MMHQMAGLAAIVWLWWLLSAVNITLGNVLPAKRDFKLQAKSQEAAVSRDYFYVGGKYVDIEGGSAIAGQMYVEKLSPNLDKGCESRGNLIFIHGQGQTGTVS